jgi:RNA polymerase sigma-70 factor (ECF subfamily)
MDVDELRSELERHHRQACAWALSICRYDPAEADNVLQTAYVNVLARRAEFSGSASFRTWWFSVIRKTALQLRRGEWLRRLRGTEEDAVVPAPARGPDEQVAADERNERLRGALARLPQRQREVLHLVFFEDLSIAEAASVMRVSLGSARRHYERAKHALRTGAVRADEALA